METTIVGGVYSGVMGKKMETTIVCWGYIWTMVKKMDTTIVCWATNMEQRLGSNVAN